MSIRISKPAFVSEHVAQGRYVFLDLAVKPRYSPTVNCVGHEDCKADYLLDRKGFHYHAIEIIESGEWLIHGKGITHHVGPGSVFSYAPNSHFVMEATGPGPWSKYFVDFSAVDASDRLKSAKVLPLVPRKLKNATRTMDLFNRIIESSEYPQSAIKKLSENLLELILIHLEQDTMEHGVESGENETTYQRCRQYLNTHFRELKSVQEWSNACHVSAAHLSRLFTKTIGENPARIMTRLKMEHAAHRIRFDRIPVKRAAAEVGFSDPYHFSRVFKATYGIAPSHYK